jgi:hypothetical protein
MGHVIKQHVQLAPERGERAAGQRGGRGVEFQVEPVQLDDDPRIGRGGADGLVEPQRPGRAVDAACISSRAPSRATSSRISGSCLPEANNSSMWPWMRSVGDTRCGMGVGPSLR